MLFVVSSDKEDQQEQKESNQVRKQVQEVPVEKPNEEGVIGLLKGLFDKFKGRGKNSGETLIIGRRISDI